MKWKIGDVAVCIKVGALNEEDSNCELPPLRYKAEYIIQNIYQCPKCKAISFDVGLSSRLLGTEGYVGTECCTEVIPCKGIHWCSSERFVKKKSKEEQLEEAIKEENYERASELRDELK